MDLSRRDNNNNNNNNDDTLYHELYKIVKQTRIHFHNHYDNIVDYYKKMIERMNHMSGYSYDDSNDEWNGGFDKEEKEDIKKKLVIKEEKETNLKKSSKLIKSMIKLNHYIKEIEYKISFIKGETKYNLLYTLYSLRKQYQDDMIEMLKYL